MSGNDTSDSSRWGGIIELQPQQLIRVAVLGFVVGIVAWLVTLFASEVVLPAIPCGEASDASCAVMTADTSSAIATLLASVVGLLGLVKLGVYRPIIVVIAAVICLWPLNAWTQNLFWFESIAWHGILYMFLYTLFSWLVRPRSIVTVLLVVIPVVVLIRWVSML